MRTYLIQLSVPSGFISPWQSDTLYGHLCWIAERSEAFRSFRGAAGFIDLFRHGPPPLVISDGFPGEMLPSPVDLRERFLPASEVKLDRQGYAELKQLKKAAWLTRDQFTAYQRGVPFSYQPPEGKPLVHQPTLHNQIGRLNNTTSDGGGLFELDEHFVTDGIVSIYARIDDNLVEDVRLLFEHLAYSGFGAKKTSGKGAFKVMDFAPFSGFDLEGTPDAFVTLSHCVPAENDPTDGAYRVRVKYGKLGEEKTYCGNPFKKPLAMLKPGAVFRCQTPTLWCGRLVENIAYTDPTVVQFGFGFAVSIVH